MSPTFDNLPDLLVLVRRDGVLLGHAGGSGVALQPSSTAVGNALDSIWPAEVVQVIRQLVQKALVSRTTHDARFSDGTSTYEARVTAQGPERAVCLIRRPSDSGVDESATTGKFGAVAAHFERRSFLRRFQESLAMATLREQPAAVAVIHVDGVADLARIMDTQVAERTMSAAISRLAALGNDVADGNPVCGPEPVCDVGQLSESQIVLVVQSRDRDVVEALVRRHCDSLRAPIRIGEADFQLMPYAGVAILGPDASTPRSLLRNAQSAAAEARRNGTRTVAFFSDTVRLRSLARMDIAKELRDAIAGGAIKLRYLARHDLATGERVAAVGYLRWSHPLRGDVPPAEFLAAAETTGLSAALSRSALKCLNDDFPALQSSGGSNLRVSFGPLRQHILDDGFLEDIQNLLAAGAIPAASLELRIGERSLVACDLARLHALARLGVQLIVDEVGRGISSFDVLARAPLSGLQLDRSWVRGLPHEEIAMKMCRAGFGLAAALGLESIARGVDSMGRRDLLAMLGCRQGVGDLYGEIK